MSDSASAISARALLSAILSYLAGLKHDPFAASLLLSTDSLDAALDCLCEATGLPRPAAVTGSVSAGPTLLDVYQAGIGALASSSSPSAASSPSPSPSPSRPPPSSTFSDFVALLSARGFFAGLEPGSAAYDERLTAARHKYDDKYAAGSGGASGSTEPAASAPAPRASSTGSSSSPASASDLRAAEQLKAEGNAFLSSHDYGAAVQRYTAAIALNGQSAIYFGNRAAAYINLSQWTDAERDCRDAINIDQHYGKAHYRLGQSLLAQGRAGEAVSAFEAALRFTDASMRSTIDEQLTAARRQAGGAELDSGSGDGGEEAGSGGLGGFDFASLLSNPMIAQMAEQLAGGAAGEGGGLDFNSLLSNPQLMQMASSLFGGGVSGGSTGGAANSRPAASRPAVGGSPSAPSLPSLSAFLSSPAAASLSSDPDLAPVLADVRANGESALGRHLSNPKLLAKLSSIAAQMSSNK